MVLFSQYPPPKLRFSGRAPCTLFASLCSCLPAMWWRPACLPLHSLLRGRAASWPLSLQRTFYVSALLHKPPKKPISCWLTGSIRALHFNLLFFFFFTSAFVFYSGGNVLSKTVWRVVFFPDTICLQSEMCWKAAGIVCLNLQINQATPASTSGFCLNIWYLSFPRRLKWA